MTELFRPTARTTDINSALMHSMEHQFSTSMQLVDGQYTPARQSFPISDNVAPMAGVGMDEKWTYCLSVFQQIGQRLQLSCQEGEQTRYWKINDSARRSPLVAGKSRLRTKRRRKDKFPEVRAQIKVKVCRTRRCR
jgi:hypothetical protein